MWEKKYAFMVLREYTIIFLGYGNQNLLFLVPHCNLLGLDRVSFQLDLSLAASRKIGSLKWKKDKT